MCKNLFFDSFKQAIVVLLLVVGVLDIDSTSLFAG